MKPDIYWVTGPEAIRLGLMARPRAGDWLEEEISGWRAAGVGTVVSLLEAHEVRELGLSSEASLCAQNGIEFLTLPIKDRGTPPVRDLAISLIDDLAVRVKRGTSVAIHCRAGIGRTGLIAGCVLSQLGMPFADIFAALSKARRATVPDTSEQVDWVRAFASKGVR